jgi:hypothetical protein
VYHVDKLSGTGGANRRPDWNGDDLAHYFIRIEQGDGEDNLECGADADGGDTFPVGTSITATSIRSAPYRSTKSYQSGLEQDTGITLRVDSAQLDGQAIRVQYTTTSGGVNPARNVSNSFPLNCSAGYYGRPDGSCLACPVGKYSAAAQPCISGCQICPDGKYSDSPGSASCTSCPAGTYDDIT